MLSIIELVINNKILSIIKQILFYANNRRYSNLFNISKNFPQAEKVLKKIQLLKKIYKKILQNIKYNQKQIKLLYNIRKKKKPQLKKKNKIYLLIKNFKTIRLNQKLDYKKIGSFFIKKYKGKFNFELDFPKKIKIHPIFYIFLLEPANPEISISTKSPKLSPKNEYKIKKIINYNHKNQQYLIK